MGGLVVKKVCNKLTIANINIQALIIAHNIARYHLVTQNTIAIVFLGTPHRGAHLAKLLNAIFNVSLLGLGIKIISISSTEYIQSSAMDQSLMLWHHFQTVLHASPIPTLHAQ